MSTAWTTYYRWNEAIAEVLFPEVDDSQPVYLDFEEDSQRALGEWLGIPWDSVEAELVKSVRSTLDLGAPSARLFEAHDEVLERWLASDDSGPPPVLPVLSLFSLAAERMSAGQGFSASNYYGRLSEVLQLDDGINLTTGYQRVAERFWGALNWWLEDLGGSRGLPTARAVTHRFVGLSVSQALIRDVDRDRLIDFFVTHGYPPGAVARPQELELPLDSWIQQHPSPVSHQLRQLWRRKNERQQICNVVANALETWDGRVARQSDGGASGGRRIGLSVSISKFPSRRVSITALVYLEDPTEPRDAQLLSSEDQRLISLLPGTHSALSLGQRGELEHQSLMEGILRVRDTRSGAVAQRLPKRLVVFRNDPLSNRMIEATQGVMLGEELVILARQELAGKLFNLLEACARPGFEQLPAQYEGLPPGWTAVHGVEIFNVPDQSLVAAAKDLAALVPLSETNLVTTGGLVLPGLTRNRWHWWSPPEVTVVSNHPDGFVVEIKVNEEVLASVSDHEGVAMLRLAELDLEPLDYRVDVMTPGSDTALASVSVKLRDADTIDERQWATAQPLFRPLDSPEALLSALPADGLDDEEARFLRGALIQAPARRARLREAEVPKTPHWLGNPTSKPRARRQHLSVAVPRADSCIYTGAHHEEIPFVPQDSRGKPAVPFVVSRCKNCGMTRRYRTDWWAIQRESKRVDEARKFAFHDLALIEPKSIEDREIEWELALDALMHTGGGTWHLFERVVNQIDPSALFVDAFARALESLGHLEIQRGALDLRPVAWEIGPRTLVPTPRGFFLSGYWPGEATVVATESIGEQADILENLEGPDSWYLPSLPPNTVLTELDAAVSVGWEGLAQELDPLSALVESLPVREVHVQGQLRRFELSGAAWTEAQSVALPGAYRMNHYTTLDVLRTEEDLTNNTMRLGLVHLNKHAAALIEGKDPLLYYDESAQRLAVPLGMDLPGLYGRAVVLASGRLPVADRAKNLLVYVDVPKELAAHIFCLLSS